MTPTIVKPADRMLSLDVLRGITIAFMIMVNNNGGAGSWGFMNHADWNGLTPTDLVFPTFVFVVGASIVFAAEARLRHGATRASLAWHTVRRAVILFLLGLVVNGFPTFPILTMRYYGVLQRIAIVYLVVGLFYVWDRRVWTKIAALFVSLAGYWALLRFVPVPGAGMPGRDVPFMDQRMNLVSWFDRLLMPHHLYLDWVGPNLHNVRDPEGMISNLPAFGTALLGVLAAQWMRSLRPVKQKAMGLGRMAVVSLILGYGWSLEFPLNKNMWTSSFVLVAAGWSLTVLTFACWAVDVWGWGKGRSKWLIYPWLVLGSNAIVAYMFSELVPQTIESIHFYEAGKRMNPLEWVMKHVCMQMPDIGWATFTFSVLTLAFCFIPVWILYRYKIFVKV